MARAAVGSASATSIAAWILACALGLWAVPAGGRAWTAAPRPQPRARARADTSGDLDGVPLSDARDPAELPKDHARVGTCGHQAHVLAQGCLLAPGGPPILHDLDDPFAVDAWSSTATTSPHAV